MLRFYIETESYKKYKHDILAELKELRENPDIDSFEQYLFEMNKIIGKKRIVSRKKVDKWITKGFFDEENILNAKEGAVYGNRTRR